MAYEAALSLINGGLAQLLDLQKSVVQAQEDRQVSPMEWTLLIMKGSQLATSSIAMAQGLDTKTKQEVLHVIRHGQLQWTLPPEFGGP